MKRVFARIIASFLFLGTVVGCAPGTDGVSESGTLRVLTPMPGPQGQYSLGFFELEGISNLHALEGKFVRFFMSPRIENGQLEGIAPQARFIRSIEGNYIPANELTQQLVTVYAHMQRLALLDEELGAKGVNSWPRSIGVSVRVKGGLNNNAFYDGETDSMLFVPYNQAGLPIAINGGILAHEHFHSLFYKMSMPDSFLKGALKDRLAHDRPRQRRQIPELPNGEDIYRLVITRALNEGLADYWGWMYTGDPDFLTQSLPKEGVGRSLKSASDASLNSLPSQETVYRSLNNLYSVGGPKKTKDFAIGFAYSLATQYSRAMKRFTEIFARARNVDSLTSRKEVGKIIIKTLPRIKEVMQSLGDEHYTSGHFIISLAEQVPNLKKEECAFLVDLLNNSSDVSRYSYICLGDGDQRIEKQPLEQAIKKGWKANEVIKL